ncbi:chorismate synthase, chloroplastic-like [Malus domestica]|uniref:chorismate synthase, chloroplastic-like n=1 Tax=Malus domestica TaxID=3750 RepID=UPI0039771B71
MASSLVSIPFLGAPTTNALSGLRTTSSSVQFVMRPRTAKKLQVQAAGNITGNHFRVTTFGEAHGGGVGCVIDGCPPRLPLSEKDLQGDLDRRRPGQSPITTLRKETDTCRILSGVHEGVTTGTPILVLVPNTDQKGRVYDEMSVAYRPSHADRTYDQKYGIRSVQGGGRSSARETIGRVAAGALAKKILKAFSGTEVLAYVSQVQKVVLPEELVDHHTLTLDQGQLPRSLANCVMLEYLVLSNNRFDGVFPVWLGTLLELKLLAMRHNGFYRVIGKSRKNVDFCKLRILDLAYNNFTGAVPSVFPHIIINKSTYM